MKMRWLVAILAVILCAGLAFVACGDDSDDDDDDDDDQQSEEGTCFYRCDYSGDDWDSHHWGYINCENENTCPGEEYLELMQMLFPEFDKPVSCREIAEDWMCDDDPDELLYEYVIGCFDVSEGLEDVFEPDGCEPNWYSELEDDDD